jgi:hypothetical protein
LAHTRLMVVTVLLWVGSPALTQAQDEGSIYFGGLIGISTLSADARASTQPARADISLYKPENGPALNVYAGAHLARFFSVQANYVWNRNDVALFGSFVTAAGGGFYEQSRTASQHAVVGDALLYFRPRGSGIRPYLSTGVGVVRIASASARGDDNGLAPPAADIRSSRFALRVAVGIDLVMRDRWSFRYSFSETISGNPISTGLTPSGERNLANFQNLFGVIRRF